MICNLIDNTSLRQTTSAVATWIVATAMVVSVAQAGPRISGQVASGRVFAGEVSSQTDATRLWLVNRSRSAELLRPIAWNRVVSAQLNGETLAAQQLRERLVNSTPLAEMPAVFSSQVTDETEHEPELLPEPIGRDGTMSQEAQDVLFTAPKTVFRHKVVSVSFDAYLANWDGDVEADGLIVQAIPLDAGGHTVPVKGHLVVELFAARRIAFQDGPQLQGRRIEQIGRWTKQVAPPLVHPEGAWFKLPFQAEHPEFNTRIATSGLVHVKLVVPGDGVFEASLDGIRIRPYAPLRDNLQQVEGRRFLPNERTGRGVPSR